MRGKYVSAKSPIIGPWKASARLAMDAFNRLWRSLPGLGANTPEPSTLELQTVPWDSRLLHKIMEHISIFNVRVSGSWEVDPDTALHAYVQQYGEDTTPYLSCESTYMDRDILGEQSDYIGRIVESRSQATDDMMLTVPGATKRARRVKLMFRYSDDRLIYRYVHIPDDSRGETLSDDDKVEDTDTDADYSEDSE